MNDFWGDFMDWLRASFSDHPTWTLIFGAMCFIAGGIIL